MLSNSHELMLPECSALALSLILFPKPVLLSLDFTFPEIKVVTTLSLEKFPTWFLGPGLQLPAVKSFLLFFVSSQLVGHSH